MVNAKGTIPSTQVACQALEAFARRRPASLTGLELWENVGFLNFNARLLSLVDVLPSLRHLAVTGFRCKDTVFAGLARLTALTHLHAEGKVSDTPEELFQFEIGGDEDDGGGYTVQGLQQLSQLTGLRHLALTGDVLSEFCNNTGTVAFLSCLSELRHLDVSSSKITSADLAHVAHLTALEHLEMQQCKVDSIERLASLTALRHLNVDEGKVTLHVFFIRWVVAAVCDVCSSSCMYLYLNALLPSATHCFL